jgi:ribose transport system permease protein
MWLGLLVVFVAMSLLAPSFLTFANMAILLRRVSIDGLFAVGMAFALIAGMFDLSMGSVAALAAILAISLQPWGMVPACLVAILVSCAIGAFNGLLITKWKINALIATLAMSVAVKGAALAYTGSRPVHGQIPIFTKLGNGDLGPIPYVTLVFVVALLIGHHVLTRMQFGRNLFALGGNPDAARLSGVNVERHVSWVFVITGLMAGLGGVILASRLDYGSGIMAQDVALTAITADVIGGVSLAGAEGSMAGVLVGTVILAMLGNGMVLLGIPVNYQLTIKGLVLLLVVGLDAYMANQRRKRLRVPMP